MFCALVLERWKKTQWAGRQCIAVFYLREHTLAEPAKWKVQFPRPGPFVCGVCVLSLCLRRFAPATAASSCSPPKKCECEVNWGIRFARRCKCEWLFVCLCGPVINWRHSQGMMRPLTDGCWDRLQRPFNLECQRSGCRKWEQYTASHSGRLCGKKNSIFCAWYVWKYYNTFGT